MKPLPQYFARQAIERLDLDESTRRQVSRIVELLDETGRVRVGSIHEELSALATPASANKALSRLIKKVNEVAAKSGIEMRITADKKAGQDRLVWFEGPVGAPEFGEPPELAAVRASGAIVEGQRGVVIPEEPVIVLLTFNEHETRAVQEEFCPGRSPETVVDQDGAVYYLLGECCGARIVHQVSGQGPGPAQQTTQKACAYWNPRAVIGVGIAFGVKEEKQRIGDVLVSSYLLPYDRRKERQGGPCFRGERPPASRRLLDRFRDWSHTCEQGKLWPRIWIGGLLTGGALEDNREHRDQLLKQSGADDIVGGEMEASGIYEATADNRTDWIIVKGICDWGHGKDNPTQKEDQRLAAKNAARVLHAVLAHGPLYYSSMPPGPRTPEPPDFDGGTLKDYKNTPYLVDDPRGVPVSMKDGEVSGPTESSPGVDVMQRLVEWAEDQQGTPLFALLGEYGMGKTVTCQRFTEYLSEQRRKDPARPIPLYVDLRNLPHRKDWVPTLEETVLECLNRPEGCSRYTMDHFWEWVSRGAVVIFDGLDEVLVHMDSGNGNLFTRGLVRLADTGRQRSKPGVSLKILFSCRTHYFPNLAEQRHHFTGQGRGNTPGSSFSALLLLPFTQQQVKTYFRGLEGIDSERAIELLRTTHDLDDLSRRPVMMQMIGHIIEPLERERMAGRAVTTATLYRQIAEDLLGRDGGKHHIVPAHKIAVVEHLAAHLWCSGETGVQADVLGGWFHDWRETQPGFGRYRNMDVSLLEEDLRTATFLIRRDDDRGGWFGFAHTSMQEFFLASYLFSAARGDQPTRWAMRVPSRETLDFLGQLFDEQPDALAAPNRWVRTEGLKVSELLLRYTLHAHRAGHAAPILRGLRLPGADLSETVFDGYDRLLDLTDADFSEANLRRSDFGAVTLRHARFAGAKLEQACFLDCDLTDAAVADAMLADTTFRSCLPEGISLNA